MKILTSPNENISENQVVSLQDTLTKIKLAILSNASNEEIQKIIDNYCQRYKDKTTQNALNKNLKQSAQKMKYQYQYNMKVINDSFIKKVIDYSSGITETKKSIIVDIKKIYNNYLEGTLSQTKVIDQFRGYITSGTKGLPIIRNYDKKVMEQVKLLASENGKYVDKNGKSISLRNKVEMSVRYQENMKDLENFRKDVKLVWTSSHADASPRCSKWQGKLYSLDGSYGKIDGIKYEPIENALRANGGNSIINGYNCRHYLIEYQPKSKPPKTFTKKEMQKQYKIDQKQRYYENQIRLYKSQELLLNKKGFENEANKYLNLWIKLEKKYEQFSKENNRAFYRWRTEILEEEIGI